MIEPNLFENICVCCLHQGDNLKNMLMEVIETSALPTHQLYEVYTTCSGILLEIGTSNMICRACEGKLLTCYEFREQCHTSYTILKDKVEVFVDVKQEQTTEEDEANERVYNTLSITEPSSLVEVLIKNESVLKSQHSKPKKYGRRKKKKSLINVPVNVGASDLESDYVCFHCDIVLPTHREYLAHYSQHRIGNSYARIVKVCEICNETTKAYLRHIIDKHTDYKPYKCKYCSKAYQTSGELRKHLTTHVNRTYLIHKCKACNEQFKNDELLRNHIFHHRNYNSQYFCPNCGLNFDEFALLNDHFVVHHDSKKAKSLFPCFKCKKIYMVRKYFNEHECAGDNQNASNQTMIRSIPCERCNGEFRTQDEFVCHEFLGCRVVEPYNCEICNKTFLTKPKLKKHALIHVPRVKSYICDVCGHGSTNEFKYNIHKASHETERKFKCQHPGCAATFKHIQYLRNHQVNHEKKPYECDLCKKKFLNFSLLKYHMAIHSDSSDLRRFACEICDKRSATSGAHTTHMLRHTGERNVKCKACPKKFPDLAKANQHFRKHHEGIYWQCKYCDVTVKEAVRFRQHLFVHRGFKPYNCPSCPMQYTDKFLYKRHLLKHHNIVFDIKVHGYVEKDNLDDLVKECERKNYEGLPAKKDGATKKPKVELESTIDEEAGVQYDLGGYLN